MKTLTLLGILLVFLLVTAAVTPVLGPVAGLSPVSTAWAAPNCDADGDGFIKDNKYCRNRYPGPYDCDDGAFSASNDCSGSSGGGELGSAIPMSCILEGVSGDGSGDTIKSDVPPRDYQDAVDKVDCSIDGPSVPWPIRLAVGAKGKPENSARKVDVFLGDFEMGTFDLAVPGASEGTSYLKDLYPNLFREAEFQNLDDMEPIRINVRPYRNTQTEDGIHLLPWQAIPYEMGMRFSIPGTERFSVSIASEHYEGNESFTGIGCETGLEAEILTNAPTPDGKMQDVSVYLWPDDDTDGFPDGYTVTTGSITVDANGTPSVSAGPRYAAVCSSVGPLVCGNPRAPSNCNFLGYVKMQFTLHTVVN